MTECKHPITVYPIIKDGEIVGLATAPEIKYRDGGTYISTPTIYALVEKQDEKDEAAK